MEELPLECVQALLEAIEQHKDWLSDNYTHADGLSALQAAMKDVLQRFLTYTAFI